MTRKTVTSDFLDISEETPRQWQDLGPIIPVSHQGRGAVQRKGGLPTAKYFRTDNELDPSDLKIRPLQS